MAAMASSFLPVNNGAPVLPTDPVIVPEDRLQMLQREAQSMSMDQGNTQEHTISARRDNRSMSEGEGHAGFPPVDPKLPNAEGSVPSDGNSEGEHEHEQEQEQEQENDDSENGADTASIAGPPSKKKKGQRFFCTDFPPCNLSFTRSEHLARHIRCVDPQFHSVRSS